MIKGVVGWALMTQVLEVLHFEKYGRQKPASLATKNFSYCFNPSPLCIERIELSDRNKEEGNIYED